MGLTPMMQQYLQIKENYKDCILFFRLGDFYEMFFEDAEIVSKELELVLTGKNCGLEERAPMCGIPFHASNSYMGRLVAKGYKVAICEQVEDPALAKGIVKREVIRIVTPGTYNDSSFLDEHKNNYIVSIYAEEGKNYSISASDISTGEFLNTSFNNNKSLIYDEVSKFSPSEIIMNDNISEELEIEIKNYSGALITKKGKEYFDINGNEELKNQFNKIDLNEVELASASALIKYIIDTQKMSLSNINVIDKYSVIDYMSIDANSRRNLEITESLREKGKKGTLLWVLDKSETAMGGRNLRRWVEQPLITKKAIEDRLDAVEELYSSISLREDLREALKDIYDIERILGKVSNQNVNAKDLISLKVSLSKIPTIKSILSLSSSNLLRNFYENIDELEDIKELLEKAICNEPSLSVKEGDIIKDGYNAEVDELRGAKSHGKEWIAALENREREVTGIKSLKVGYNKVFGYYIEISKANYDLIPEGRYVRKQTLANAERFITQELKEMEDKILGAEEKLVKIEYELFCEVRNIIEAQVLRLQKSAKIIADLDCLCTFAKVALENNFVRPKVNEDGIIDIKEGRHPVVEKVIPKGEFISNNTLLDRNENELLIITGPNMAGKSTYMRQVALITIMAQIGSFVPATEANINICDKVFTRIGASDDLAGGKSTFMVEMWEVSNILKNATSKSLVLLDEVGRGTSTYDGLSIAWSVIEYISQNENLRCNTLFATHYHELTALEGKIHGVKNYSVAVKEMNDNIVFLRKIVKGGADQSYGIQVAKLAGIPDAVINRAKDILAHLEETESSNKQNKEIALDSNIEHSKEVVKEVKVEEVKVNEPVKQTKKHKKEEAMQMDFESLAKDAFIKDVLNIDVLTLTPMDAMNKLYEVIKEAKKLI